MGKTKGINRARNQPFIIYSNIVQFVSTFI